MTDRFEFDLTEFLLDLRRYDKSGDQELWMGKTLAGFRLRVDRRITRNYRSCIRA